MMSFESAKFYWRIYLARCEKIDDETRQDDWVSYTEKAEKARLAFEYLTGWNLFDYAKEIDNDR